MSGEKTEEPTPKKIRDAREKGQVAKSQDLSMALLFLALSLLLLFSGSRLNDILGQSMKGYIAQAFAAPPLNPDSALALLLGGLDIMFEVLLPLLTVAFVFGGLVVFAQVGPLFSPQAIAPQLSKLDPIKGFKTKFFSAQTYIEMTKSIFKIVVVGLAVYLTLRGSLRDIGLTVRHPIEASQALTGALLQSVAIRVGVLFLVIGAIDVFVQRWQHTKKLKMSKDDVKREHKQQEGDPMLKGERKRLHQEVLQHSMIEDVKNADVVIINPTHLAIAIRYKKGEMGAPEVTAKGQRLVAKQIIEVARQYKVPIMRNVPLAHALIELEIGDGVPEELYTAVAEVLNWVYAQNSERSSSHGRH